LKEGRLPFEVRVNTSETKGKAHDMPDFVLGDDKMFVGVYGEVKRANVRPGQGLFGIALSSLQPRQWPPRGPYKGIPRHSRGIPLHSNESIS